MNIKKVALHNFRNFQQVDEIAFPPSAILVAAAPNATGKTNFLEALVVLLRAKSFRGGLEQCVRWGEETFLLRGVVNVAQGDAALAIRYHVPTRKVRIEENSIPTSPITFFQKYPLVVFLPEDTFLFNRGPALRRSFLNQVLVSTPGYVSALVQYHRALKQRNTVIRHVQQSSELQAWTELLVEHSSVVWNIRESFLQFITSHLAEIYQNITGEEREFTIRLTTSTTAADAYRQQLEDSFATERRYGYTLYGPHRDDVQVVSEGKPLAAALSRGQLRSVVIALKIAAGRYLKHVTGEEPLFLFDEVLSELDEDHQRTLLTNLPNAQVLLTCTAVPKVLRERSDVHLLDLRSILATQPTTAPQNAPQEAVRAQP